LIEEILKLFKETRQWRLYHKSCGKVGQIEAAACAIRENALLDALIVIGLSVEERRKLEKL
jgi:hypothetical protein